MILNLIIKNREIFTIFIIRFLSSFLSFLLFILLSNLLSSTVYGQFSYCYSLIALFALISYFGFELTLVKFLPSYKDNTKKILSIFFFILIVGFFISIFILIILFLNKDNFESILSNQKNIIFLIPLIAFFFLARNIFITFFNTFDKTITSQIIDFSFIFSLFLLYFYIFVLNFYSINNFNLSLNFLILSCIFSSFLSLILSIYLFNNFIIKFSLFTFDLSDRYKWLKTSVPIYIRDLSYLTFYKGDIFLLGFFVDPILIGYYFTSQKVISGQDIVLDSLLIKIRAAITHNIYIKNFKKSNQIIKKTTIISFLFASISGLILFFLSDFILKLFNIENNLAIEIFKLIVIYQIIISSLNYIIEPLIYADKQNLVVGVGVFFNCLNLLLLFLFMENNNIITFINIVYLMRILSTLALIPVYWKIFVKINN